MHLFSPILFLWTVFFGGPVETVVTLKQHSFGVEVMRSDFDRARGLMARLYMPEDRGMIFVYDQEEPRAFWMKNTILPLDMVFMDAGKKVVEIKKNILPCKLDPCPTYLSVASAQFVLELNAGTADRIGLSIGDQMY